MTDECHSTNTVNDSKDSECESMTVEPASMTVECRSIDAVTHSKRIFNPSNDNYSRSIRISLTTKE